DVRLDLLDAADDPGVDEVAQALRLGRREGRRSAVGLTAGAARRTAAAAPLEAPVAVQVGTHVGRTRIGLAVLAPGPVGAGRDVILAAIRVHVRDDPDLAAVH